MKPIKMVSKLFSLFGFRRKSHEQSRPGVLSTSSIESRGVLDLLSKFSCDDVRKALPLDKRLRVTATFQTFQLQVPGIW